MALFPLRSSMLAYRFSCLWVLAFIFFLINIVSRLSLQYFFSDVLPFGIDTVSHLFFGLINDFFALLFVLIIPVFLFFLPGDKFLKSVFGKYYAISILFVYSLIFAFTAFSEYFFWEEFGCRFNFIAVDYLIYTTEVIGNIVESYPVFWLLLAVFVLALVISASAWQYLHKKLNKAVPSTRFLNRFVQLLCFCLIAAGSYFVFEPS